MNKDYKRISELKWIPDGFHFIGIEDSKKRRKLIDIISNFFLTNQYKEVIPSSFDFTSLFTNHVSISNQPKILKSRDLMGNEISPSIDLTLQVVKGLSNYIDKDNELKVFYISKVIRDIYKSNGDRREILQSGCEILGSSNYLTFQKIFSEIDSLCNLLKIKNKFTLVLGNVQIFSEIIKSLNLSGKEIEEIFKLIYSKDKYNISKLNLFSKVKNEIILDLLLSFEIDDIKQKLSNYYQQNNLSFNPYIKETFEIINYCKSNLKNLDVCIDFSLIRDMDYYTGFVFHVYGEGHSEPLMMGGGYDHLFEKFSGIEKKACGFAINLELLEEMFCDE